MTREIPPKIQDIMDCHTMIGDTHESSYRASQILIYIMGMVERGDSKETIWDVYLFMSGSEKIKDEGL